MRLQHENKMLCAQELSYRTQQAELQILLEESNRTKNQLEAQQRYPIVLGGLEIYYILCIVLGELGCGGSEFLHISCLALTEVVVGENKCIVPDFFGKF